MSPGNEQRPGGNQGARCSQAADSTSVAATTGFLRYLAEATGPDDPAFQAARLIADAWGPALDRSYRLGYRLGYDAGYYQSERDMEAAWASAARTVQRVLDQPTFAEMQARRANKSSDGDAR